MSSPECRRGLLPFAWVVMAAIVVLTAACQRQPEEAPKLIVATSWGGAGAEVLTRELFRLTQDLGQVEVDLRFFSPTGLADHVLRRQSARGTDRVDVAIVPNEWLGQLAERGIITELPTARVARLRERLLRQAVLAVSERDRALAYPLSAEVLALVYDPQRFPSQPRTMDEVLAASLPAEVLPFGMSILDIHHMAPFVAAYQGSLANSEGTFLWRDDVLLQVLRQLAPVWRREDGWLVLRAEAQESLLLQLFVEGKLASFVAGPWLLPALEEAGRPFAVMPIPGFADSPYPARGLVGYQCLTVLRESPWVDLGLELGERLLDSAVSDRLCRGTRRLPVVVGAFRTEEAMESSGTVGFWRALEAGQSSPTAADWTEGFRAAADRLQRLRTFAGPPTLDQLPGLLSGGLP